MTVLTSSALPAADGAPAPAPALCPGAGVLDPLPLPQPGWGAEQARDAVAEAALVLPELAGPAVLVRAVSTVVFRLGDLAVKVHPPGTDPAHLARVHTVLADSPVAVTAGTAPVVTSSGVVTTSAWTDATATVAWAATGRSLRTLHDLPTAALLPSWVPLRRLPAQLAAVPPAYARLVLDRRSQLLAELADLTPVLPPGAVHGDVSPDNVLATSAGPRWIDLDFACFGLREYDLAAVVRRHSAGELSDADYGDFVAGYGVDLRGWPGLPLLDDLCRLSGLGFRLWTDRAAGRASDWLPAELGRLSPVPAAR